MLGQLGRIPGCSDLPGTLHEHGPIPDRFPMRALLEVLLLALQLYLYLIVASAVLSWLVAFNVVNTRNDFVRSIWNFLNAVTEPALRPIRQILPNLGGVDISPIILILLIIFIQKLIVDYLLPVAF
jgi:YggT family protein